MIVSFENPQRHSLLDVQLIRSVLRVVHESDTRRRDGNNVRRMNRDVRRVRWIRSVDCRAVAEREWGDARFEETPCWDPG